MDAAGLDSLMSRAMKKSVEVVKKPEHSALCTSTIDSFNRVRDQASVKKHIGLPEEGNDNTMLVSAHNDTQIFLATGYTRIVYGDHGPYFEFDENTH